MGFMQDDMLFEPYQFPDDEIDGFQCKMKVSTGIISVRHKGRNLSTDKDGIYEVWYPEDDTPVGYQTADDIWNYIKKINKCLINGD